ncbi:MAG: hypothetical protein DMG49_08990 [Acidobacteria bacterium]|nr:MAG: hypothetical protein DMG49_08990 [Acidobacteriota bacterium]
MRKLLITADTGWSNGWRLRLRKSEFLKFADRSGLDLIDIAFDQRGAGQRHGQHLAQMLQKREQSSAQAARIFLVLSIGSQYQNS